MSTSRAGAVNFPSRSVSLSGFRATARDTAKNPREYTALAPGPVSPAKGTTAIWKEVPAVRGMARQGPMAR